MSTPYKVFFREIPNILRTDPLSHKEIARRLKEKFPDFCDDLIPCPHVNDNSGHPEWDHLARSAEQGLKRKKIISYNHAVKKWGLILKGA
jgi:hypothetical protein